MPTVSIASALWADRTPKGPHWGFQKKDLTHMENYARKPVARENIFYRAENKQPNAGARMRVDKDTRESIIRLVLKHGRSLREVQLSTMRGGRMLNQDAILGVVLEHVYEDAERRVREAEYEKQNIRRAYTAELRRTA